MGLKRSLLREYLAPRRPIRRGEPPSTGMAHTGCSSSVPVKLPTSNSDLSGEISNSETLEKGVSMGIVSPPKIALNSPLPETEVTAFEERHRISLPMESLLFRTFRLS